MAEREPGGAPVIGGAVEEDRRGQGQAQAAKELLEQRPAQAVQPEIGGQREQHDVPESKPGNPGLEPAPLAARVRRLLPRLQFPERQLGLVAHRSQQSHQLAQGNLPGQEGDRHLAFQEIHLGGADGRVEPKQVLEQPNAGHTMDRRDAQGEPAETAIAEVQQLFLHRGFIQAPPAVPAPVPLAWPHPRVPGQGVVTRELVFSQQVMHQQAPLAAKDLVVPGQTGVAARFAAVKTGGGLRLAGLGLAFADAGSGARRRSIPPRNAGFSRQAFADAVSGELRGRHPGRRHFRQHCAKRSHCVV